MTGSRFAGAIVAAQVLAQIGAFTLPALLPAFIERWSLSATEAGWLIGAFFAAYVATVPVLVALTDRVPARRVYLLGTAATAMSHLGFALLADGFWSALALRVVAGIGPLRAERICAAWAEQKVVREIMVFLHSHGVSTARAVRIFRT